MQKGFVGIPALILLAVLALTGAYYVGTSAGKLPSVNISLTPPLPPEVTAPASPTPASKPASSPTPIPKSQAIKLTYSLPAGWKTVQDTTGTFEIGYDPNNSELYDYTQFGSNQGKSINDLSIRLMRASRSHPVQGYDFSVAIHPYDGGSRHKFILGNEQWDKLPEYHEKEYTYNGWSCLVLYGIYISQGPVANGMCAINSKQAFSIGNGILDEKTVEQIIQTIKLLKTP